MARPKDEDKVSITLTFDEVVKTMTQLENRIDFYLIEMRKYPDEDAYRARANEISNIIDKMANAAGIHRVPRTN